MGSLVAGAVAISVSVAVSVAVSISCAVTHAQGQNRDTGERAHVRRRGGSAADQVLAHEGDRGGVLITALRILRLRKIREAGHGGAAGGDGRHCDRAAAPTTAADDHVRRHVVILPTVGNVNRGHLAAAACGDVRCACGSASAAAGEAQRYVFARRAIPAANGRIEGAKLTLLAAERTVIGELNAADVLAGRVVNRTAANRNLVLAVPVDHR